MKQRLIALLLLLAFLLLPGCGAAQSGAASAAREEAITQAAQTVEALFDALEELDEDEGEAVSALPEEAEAPAQEDAPKSAPSPSQEALPDEEGEPLLDEAGSYTSKEDVALYIYTYGHLPDNFITKKQAQALGWEGGSLEPYAPGKCIGGSHFGNYEGLLPEAEGRSYTECDIDTLGADRRGAKRIVFSNDGLIYYTEDHYESFTLLYPEADS